MMRRTNETRNKNTFIILMRYWIHQMNENIPQQNVSHEVELLRKIELNRETHTLIHTGYHANGIVYVCVQGTANQLEIELDLRL